MKKRLFAGALALLMIIGLLPVSSMLKKPVEAQAAEPKEYTYTAPGGPVAAGTNVADFFTVTNKLKDGTQDGVNYLKFDNNDREIKFTIDKGKSASVKIEWNTSKSNSQVGLYNSEGNSITATREYDGKTDSFKHFEIDNLSSGTYYVRRNAVTFLFRSITVTITDSSTEEPEAQPYTVTINDEYDDEKTSSNKYAEGAKVELLAKGVKQGKTFLYWKNSNGVIVATGDKEIPVYYSDTYTAVYAKDGAKVDYLTPYGGILETHYADEDFTAPDVPARYGYTVDGWDKNIDTVKKSLKEGTSVTVNPQYKDNAGLRYTITIDATDFDGTKNTQEYTVNTVVKASVTDTENFACWKVGDDVVSYNPTYYFFANRNVTVTAVKKDGSEVSKGAIITEVEYSADNNTVIFEYTVPDEYVMTFAGVIASTNAENLASVKDDNITIPAGVYKLGADSTKCSNYNTYRYTLRKAGNDTWYVKPVLTYTDSTGSHTIYGNTVTMK